eukprot:3790176-Lingulodinium_polyedra.AAC.1
MPPSRGDAFHRCGAAHFAGRAPCEHQKMVRARSARFAKMRRAAATACIPKRISEHQLLRNAFGDAL